MSIAKVFARVAFTAVAVFTWAGSSAFAADIVPPPPPPVVVGAAPVTVGDPGCPTCQHGAPKVTCDKCGKWFTGHRSHKAPYPVSLCPGACFGYFQTQWRKWDEVCPYPYLGTGASDAPRTPGVVPPKGNELSPPRPLDPKMADPKKVGSAELPQIPVVTSKFMP